MDFKKYLIEQKEFSLKVLANLMWPKNKTADNYLSKKLHDKMGLTFTPKDEKLARKALKQLGIKLIEDSKK
jgi:hypothetical protein